MKTGNGPTVRVREWLLSRFNLIFSSSEIWSYGFHGKKDGVGEFEFKEEARSFQESGKLGGAPEYLLIY